MFTAPQQPPAHSSNLETSSDTSCAHHSSAALYIARAATTIVAMDGRPPPLPSRRPPPPPPPSQTQSQQQQQQQQQGLAVQHPSESINEMTSTFRRVLSTKRMNGLSRTNSPVPYSDFRDYHELTPPPPAYNTIRNIPLVPEPPQDQRSQRFRQLLLGLSKMPMNWENPGLLDEALRSVPLERIYAEAEEESQVHQAEAASLGPGRRPLWGHQDCIVMALIRWFRGNFFSWVNNPPCSKCGSPTQGYGIAAPSDDERAMGANKVEVYKCSLESCSDYVRFPRYNDAFVLMNTRKGRVGEWTNCFGMLCRAMGLRVRWVWNSEDHVWIEVFSQHRKQWVHVDPCEGRFNQPNLYTEGWGRKIGYCIAFSRDGATDVTRRYVINFQKFAGERTRCSEPVLLHILEEIRHMRRSDLLKPEKFRLKGDDIREDRELSLLVAQNLAHNLCQSVPGAISIRRKPVSKAAEARQASEHESQQVVKSDGSLSQPNPQQQQPQNQF